MVGLQYDAGEVTSLAVKQTQSQKLRAQSLIPQLEREYIRQENRLNRLIGRFPESIEVEAFNATMIEEDFAAGIPLELIRNRPDIAAAEYNLQESYARVGISNALRYPSITLGASVGLNSFELDKLLNPAGSGFLLLNGLIFQPIFQKRRLKTNYEIALAEKKIAELEFRNKFLQAMNEVSDALVSIEKLKEEYAIAQDRVSTAQESVEDAILLFKSGMASYLEVITAQGEALDSELNLEDVKMQIFAADVELYRSLGGGWR
jgi:outer membrane protein TolC